MCLPNELLALLALPLPFSSLSSLHFLSPSCFSLSLSLILFFSPLLKEISVQSHCIFAVSVRPLSQLVTKSSSRQTSSKYTVFLGQIIMIKSRDLLIKSQQIEHAGWISLTVTSRQQRAPLTERQANTNRFVKSEIKGGKNDIGSR